MPRIPLVTEASMTADQRRVYDAMMSGPRRSPPVGPLAAAMHRPDLAEKWSDLGLVLRFNSSFPPRLREFVILLTGRFWDCQFEWFSHEGEARKAGLSEQTIETLRRGDSTFAPPDEPRLKVSARGVKNGGHNSTLQANELDRDAILAGSSDSRCCHAFQSATQAALPTRPPRVPHAAGLGARNPDRARGGCGVRAPRPSPRPG